ncbi:MAG: histidine kinase [Acidobacteria bacterium]|jgi:signal transduction histidine kinase/ligand-binding sensor domain-containing protein|nr:histidine kinase [Acidobacteriota bacterium]
MRCAARRQSAGLAPVVLALALAALAAPAAALAQPILPTPPLERHGPREGLFAETINALYFDRSGLLWVGTREGLFSFDGYAFDLHQHVVGDPASLADNWIRTVFEDRAGNLWVGTNAGGLNRLDRASGRVAAFRHDGGDAGTLSHDSVYAIAEAGEGRLWVGTQSGLNLFDPATGRAQRVPVLPKPNPRSGAEYVCALLPAPDGTVWIATIGDWVLRLDPASGTARPLPIPPGSERAAASADAFALAFDASGRLWIGGRFGAVVHDPRTGSTLRAVVRPGQDDSLLESVVPALAATPAGPVWLGTFVGLLRVDEPPFVEFRIRFHGGAEQDAQTEERITALALDAGGSLWLGTTSGGLARLLQPTGPFRAIRARSGPGSPSYGDITALFEDRRQRLWLGSFGGGIEVLEPGGPGFRAIPLLERGRPIADGTLRIGEDRAGTLWLAATDGVTRFDPASGALTRFRHDPADPTSLPRGYAYALLIDRDDRVWIGTGGGGLARLREDGRGFERIVNRPDDPATPSDNFVTTLHEDRAGRLWMGTRSGGVNLVDRDTLRVQRLPVDPQDPEALAHQYVTSIVEDRAGTIWIGSAGGGLARLLRLDPERGARFERITARDGLVNDNVMSIVEDDDGSLWLATRRGLTRFDPLRRTFVSYDVADGLPSSEGNLSAAVRAHDAIYVGLLNGLVAIPRGTPFPTPPPARLALTALRTLEGPAAAPGSPWPPAEVSIRHGEPLTVSFAVVDYDSHRRHRYAYRVAGGEWLDLGARRELTFTDLSPGAHRLELRARGARGEWSDPPLALTVQVVPPFYRTAWFRILSAVALAAGAITWHQVRTRRLERRNRELAELQVQREAALRVARSKEEELQSAFERLQALTRRLEAAKEEERKAIARELHDEMGQLLTAAKINIQLLQRLGPDDTAPRRLADTVGLLDRMIKLVRALSFELRPPLMDELGLVAALRGHLAAQADRTGLEVAFSDDGLPDRLPAELEIAAFRIVQEAMTNVVRHAGATRVAVRLRAADGRLRIEVEDDGQGFDPDAAAAASGGEHFGIVGMRERAEALGGRVTLSSARGRGTAIRAELPWSA